MSRRSGRLAGVAGLLLCMPALTGATPPATREASSVQRTIEGAARAFSEFPKTRDVDAVLSFYARDFTGIENGEATTLGDQRDLLLDLRDQLATGAFVGLVLRTRNIRVRVEGEIAWATYDYLFRIAAADGGWQDEEGMCSSILQKEGRAWRFKHEHCSSVCPDEGGETPEDESLERKT